MKKIFKGIYYAFLTVLVLIALLLIVSVFSFPGNIKVMAVLSGSMEPKIHTGSVVIISPAKEYKVGDIITFGKISKTTTPTTHRIAEIKDGKFVTKGDANNTADMKEVLPKDVVGKVRFSIPYAGFVIDFARKPLGFVILIIIPAVIIIYEELKKVVKELINLRKKKRILNIPPELIPENKSSEHED
jgi:signal peptidase